MNRKNVAGLTLTFADTVKGAKASAALYSLVETAKANGLEPYAYLRRLFKRLPHAKSVEDIQLRDTMTR